MLALASSELEIAPAAFDDDWSLLSTPNGVVVLGSSEVRMRPHKPADFITRETAVGYNPEARCDVWEAVLARALPDPELRDYVQRAIGYTLLGGQDEKAVFLAYGPPDGGKSTV